MKLMEPKKKKKKTQGTKFFSLKGIVVKVNFSGAQERPCCFPSLKGERNERSIGGRTKSSGITIHKCRQGNRSLPHGVLMPCKKCGLWHYWCYVNKDWKKYRKSKKKQFIKQYCHPLDYTVAYRETMKRCYNRYFLRVLL